MFRNKLIALINWLEAKHWTLARGLRAHVVYRGLYSSLLYCLYLAATRNHTASYVVSRPPKKGLNSPKFKWKKYGRIALLLLVVYLITEALPLWSFLNSSIENTTGKSVIEFCWEFVWQWISKDEFGLRDALALMATVIGLYLLNKRTKAVDKQAQLAEKGLDIDRFREGSEMLAHEHTSVRQAGIVSLKSLALSRPKEYGSLILDIFTKFLKKPDAGHASTNVHTMADRPDIHLAFAMAMEVWQHKSIRKWYLQKNPSLDMNGVRLDGGTYIALDFQFVSFRGVVFNRCNFIDIGFHSTYFWSANFDNCNFKGSSFVGTQLSGTTFVECHFFDVNWNGATVYRVGVYNEDPSFFFDDEPFLGWLDRPIQDLEKIWFCFDPTEVLFQTNGAEIYGYTAVEEECGSLKRLKFVENVPSEE